MVGDFGFVDVVLGLEELCHHVDRDVEHEVSPAIGNIDAECLEPRECKVDLLFRWVKLRERFG